MARPKGWSTTMTGRAPMRSPGRPGVSRDVQRLFWAEVAKGLPSEDAALACGVSPAVGSRWFRENGGMPQITLTVSGRYLSFAEREEIALMRAQDVGVREIARRLGRSASTISRELRRNAATRGGVLHYRASTAQWKAERQARRPKPAKLAVNEQLRTYVQERLNGQIEGPDRQTVAGPVVAWGARRHGRRKDRRWATAWSPEQISGRLPIDFPEDESMRICHEAIYQGLYVEGRGGLRREMCACLRTGRTLRKPRARTKRGKHFLSPEVRIDRRPKEAADRSVAGHWEGDLILGLGGTAIGTLVERATRFTMLLHLPPLDGHGTGPRPKNSPALAGHGAEAVREALASKIAELPAALRRTLSWDQGAEMSQHAQLSESTGLSVYFCDPHSPWQRPSNENTNGLLRQYFPKGTDLSRHSREDLDAVAAALNNRPRKTHNWNTATEMLDEQLTLQKEPGVATTG